MAISTIGTNGINQAADTVLCGTSGNVGIGTNSPSYKLHVVKPSSDNAVVIDNGGGAGDNATPYLSFSGTNGGSNYIRGRIRGALASSTAGGLVFETGSSGTMAEAARIDSSGNLLVGCTSKPVANAVSGVAIQNNSGGQLLIGKTISGPVIGAYFGYNTTTVGYISYDNTSTAYVTSSDYRLKNSIVPMTGALAKVSALKPVTYKWNEDGSDGQGFIAHELQAVVPQAVIGEKDAVDEDGNPKYQGIDTSFLVATLTAAIQEQQALITSLTERITALEGKAQ